MNNETEMQSTMMEHCAEKFVPEGSIVPSKFCPATWDEILCWPPTPPGYFAAQPCFAELNGINYDTTQNATKWCSDSSQWNKTNYSDCKEIRLHVSQEEMISAVTNIYYLGYTASLIALLIAVFILTYYRELRCLRNTIHKNLMITYILVSLMWIITLMIQVSYEGHMAICVTTIILLQYTTLTNFFWMFIEGLYLYMLVVEAFSVDSIRLRTYMMIGWGAPVPIIIVWCISRCIINIEADNNNRMLVEHCPWMVPDYVDWIYKSPTLFVLTINCVVLLRIMKVLITKLKTANCAEARQYRKYQKATKALLVLIPLLGVTYVLTMVFPSGERVVIYFRDILLSTQGLLVAVLYCFLNTEVQRTIKHRFQIWCERRNLDMSRRRLTEDSKDSPYTRTESSRQCCEDSAVELLPLSGDPIVIENKVPFIEKLTRRIIRNSLFKFVRAEPVANLP